MTAEEKQAAIISEHMRTIGARGGSVKNNRKRAAIMKNLRKAHRVQKARSQKK